MPLKQRADELAILGGQPAFVEPLHVGRPNVGDRRRFIARLEEILDRRWLTNDGPVVRELEQRLADRLQVRHCVAVCNGTVGLEIAIRAVGLTGEVIVPSFTFVATAHALTWLGLTPVFADVESAAHTLDPKSVERLVSPRTTGIIGVHLWGRACQVDALSKIAERHRLTLIFDAAHAMGCSREGVPIGRFGRAEVFSFHATKVFNSMEGGAIATDDDDLAQRLRRLRNFGFAGFDTVVSVGTNGKMSEAAAAMGLTSLESLDEFVAANRRNHEHYAGALAGLAGIRLLTYEPAEQHNHQYVVLEIDPAEAGLTRDQMHAILWADNIRARRYFHPGCHRMEPYRSRYPDAGRELPNTERLASVVLCLPTGTAVSLEDIDTVASIIKLAVARRVDLLAQWPESERSPAGASR